MSTIASASGAISALEVVFLIALLALAAWCGFHERLWAAGAVLVVAIVAAILLFGA